MLPARHDDDDDLRPLINLIKERVVTDYPVMSSGVISFSVT